MDFTHIKKAVQEVADDMTREISRKLPKATGTLKNNIEHTVSGDNTQLTISLRAPSYIQYVEEGRKPGKQPPKKAIESWIAAKPVIPRASSKPPSASQLAFLIARSIGKNGIPPTHILRDTYEGIDKHLTDKIDSALIEDINDYGKSLGE